MAKKTPIELLTSVREQLASLIDEIHRSPPRAGVRKALDEELRELVSKLEALVADLDPIRQPAAVFDPANPALVGRFIALALIAQPRIALTNIDRFYGSGVYAIYYRGEFPAYAPIKHSETPIYVGKADPARDDARIPSEQGERLSRRLKDHKRNIRKATSTLKVEDFEYRSMVVQSGWQGAAEDYLIYQFEPVWNSETNICYGIGKHGDAPSTRGNLRSPWDTLHPGREWAHRDPTMKDARSRKVILADLKRHFREAPIYRNLEALLHNFIDELSQAQSNE